MKKTVDGIIKRNKPLLELDSGDDNNKKTRGNGKGKVKFLIFFTLIFGMFIGSLVISPVQAFVFGSANQITQWLKDTTIIRLRTETDSVRVGGVSTSTLFVSPSLNRVGIATSTPSYTLDVQGTAGISNSILSPILYGSSTASGNLTLYSTSHATKGKILFGTSAYDEVNNRLGIGTASPDEGMVKIIASGATVKGLVIKGAASQSANLLEIQDSAGLVQHQLPINTGSSVVFNEQGADIDFRVETDDDINTFRIDGGTGATYITKTTSNGEWDVLEINSTHDDWYLFGLQVNATQRGENYSMYGINVNAIRESSAANTQSSYGLAGGVVFKPQVSGLTDSGEAFGSNNSITFNANNFDGLPSSTFTKSGDTVALNTFFLVNFDNSSSQNNWTVSNLYDFWGKGIGIGSKAGDTFTVTNYKRFYINDGTISSAANAARVSIGTYTPLWIDALDSNITLTGAQRSVVLNGDITAGSATALGGGIVFGAGQDASIGYDGTNLIIEPNLVGTGGVLLQTTDKLLLRDSAISINSNDDGHLDLTADTSIDLNANTFLTNIKSGATQAGAGAAAGEIWRTASHATLPDGVLMIGI